MRSVIVDPATQSLLDAVRDTSTKHQVYAYNVANALTPGFKPLRLPEDQEHVQLLQKIGQPDKVVIPEELNKIAANQAKHDSYLRLLSMKRGVLTSVIRQGK